MSDSSDDQDGGAPPLTNPAGDSTSLFGNLPDQVVAGFNINNLFSQPSLIQNNIGFDGNILNKPHIPMFGNPQELQSKPFPIFGQSNVPSNNSGFGGFNQVGFGLKSNQANQSFHPGNQLHFGSAGNFSQQNQNGGLFGGNNQSSFNGLTPTPQLNQTGTGIFSNNNQQIPFIGSTTTPPPQPAKAIQGSLFGNQSSTSTANIFAADNAQKQQQGNSCIGNNTQQQQKINTFSNQSNVFNSHPQQNCFGSTNTQQQQNYPNNTPQLNY